MGKTIVCELTCQFEEAYEAFLSREKNALFYYSLKYRDFLLRIINGEGKYQIVFDGEKITRILPLVMIDGPLGVVVNSLPFFGSNGSVLAETPEAETLLWKSYQDIIDREEIVASTVISNPFLSQDAPPITFDEKDYRISQSTSLEFTKCAEEELMGILDSSTRRNIRKANKEGVVVTQEPEALSVLAEMNKENMTAIGGTAKPENFYENIGSFFTPYEDYNVYVARYEEKIISALLLFYFGNTVEYFVPGTLPDYKNKQPSAAIIFQAMLDAFKKGYRRWNWGGTWVTQKGVLAFKRKWGAKDTKYSYFTTVKKQIIYNQSPKALRSLYPFFYVVPFDALKGK